MSSISLIPDSFVEKYGLNAWFLYDPVDEFIDSTLKIKAISHFKTIYILLACKKFRNK